MKKIIIIKTSYIVLSILLMILSFNGCGILAGGNRVDSKTIKENGYTYHYFTSDKYGCIIYDKGEDNPRYWMIEPFLDDGKEVRYFGLSWGGGWGSTSVTVPSLINVEELYLPYNMLVYKGISGSNDLKRQMPALPQKVFLVNNAEDDILVGNMYQGTNGFPLFSSYEYTQKEPLREIYLTPIGYEYRVKKLLKNSVPWTKGTQEYPSGEYCFYREYPGYVNWYIKICKANTSYMFNYENSPNDDYFFIRDYEYGKKIETVPYGPIREGYTFDGWYKEPECINAWDFETDTLPETLYNENNEEVYQETKLYAKWLENPQEEKGQEKTWWDSVLDFFGLKNRRII